MTKKSNSELTNTLPHIPQNLPFNEEQIHWVGGFLAGLHSRLAITQENVQSVKAKATALKPLTIIYGTQTGNAEQVSEQIAEQAATIGLSAKVQDMDDVDIQQLAKEERLLVVTSTYGEGEMPDNALALWEAMEADDAPEFTSTFFSVLALGDTNYDGFCVAGKLWDARLEALGATRIGERVDCDVEYESAAQEWMDKVIPTIAEKGSESQGALPENTPKKKDKPKFTRKNPMLSKLLKKKVLTAKGSSKEVCHFELSLGDSGESYKAGDTLNIIPRNSPELVAELLNQFRLEGDEDAPSQPNKTVHDVFTEDLEIRVPSKELIAEIAAKCPESELAKLVTAKDSSALDDYLWGKDIVDLCQLHPGLDLSLEQFLPLLKPLVARAYSISSSMLAHDNEVHLTIGSVRYNSNDREHNGVCSTYLADVANEGDEVACYLSPNKHFAIPSDNNKPIIMVGPGTGIAPFRAFLEERQAFNAQGENWLFFGDRNSETDFIYQQELSAMQESGLLNRLDLAFSRDTDQKVYVQDRMYEHGADLYAWLERGAYFYICGDAFRMAKDVDKTLHKIVAEQGNLSEQDATAYVNALKKQKRYVRDVY
ncbi:sulfite reductase flavoprotein subunit alpha [Alteromonas sp. 5E99-2]|nr:sulfite reductase flavoprotein subunit alpha [Alteromonas sp. 5E99-2]